MIRTDLAILNIYLALSSTAWGAAVDRSTLYGKLVVGFQGWFMCPGDGRPNGGWVHWFTANQPDAAHVRFDLLPDTSELDPDERCPTDLMTPDGRRIDLFSDQNPKTVLRQFHWMRDYRIPTVAVQRFLVAIDPIHPVEGRPAVDRVLDNVHHAAEQTGRTFFIMYDIAGADPRRWADVLVDDWKRQLEARLVSSPAYQRHRGRPVLAIAGVGSNDRPGTAAEMAALLARLRAESRASGGVTLLGSTATGWRTLDGDAKRDPAWAQVYRSFDVLSPWTVGRYRDEASYKKFRTRRLLPDMAAAKAAGVDYMPVIFPGFSWSNLYRSSGKTAQPLDEIARRCGAFVRMQGSASIGAGAHMLYGAMFDEVDEGTALFKLVPKVNDLPARPKMIPLDNHACAIGSAGYLQTVGNLEPLGNPPLQVPVK